MRAFAASRLSGWRGRSTAARPCRPARAAKVSWRFSSASPAWVMNRRAVSASFRPLAAQAAIVDLGEVLLRPAEHILDLPGRLGVVGRLAGAEQRGRRRRRRRSRLGALGAGPLRILDRRLGGRIGRPAAGRFRRRPLHGGGGRLRDRLRPFVGDHDRADDPRRHARHRQRHRRRRGRNHLLRAAAGAHRSAASTTAAVQPVRDGVRGGFNTLIGNGEKGGARLFGRQAAWGSRRVKVVPRPGVDCTSMCPSCSWIVR